MPRSAAARVLGVHWGFLMRNDRLATRFRARGFTLFEMIVTIVIVAVLAAIALPNFGSSLRNNRMTTETNDLLTAFNLARTEAVTRAAPVSVCASSDGATCATASTAWAQGWMVFVDYGTPGQVDAADGDVVLRVWSKIDPKDSISADAVFLRYSMTGTVSDGGAVSQSTFRLSPHGCTGDQERQITIKTMGRAESQHVTCGT